MTWTAALQKRVLPNGLTLLAQRAASAPVVAVVTHVRAGYFDEPDEWVGVSHVLEHMFFKGTARRGPGAIARETQLVGGYINAGTIYEKTVYYTVLPSVAGGLERALDVQADALMHAALDPDELRRELEVIVQEAKRKLDTPPAVVTESLYALLFREHRMRRWRIGTEAGLRKLTANDVRAYYETRYTPNRVVVAIVGDIDPEAALAVAGRTYGEWMRPGSAVDGSPAEPTGGAAQVRLMHGDVERPLAHLGWRTVGALHPDTPALDIASDILGAGRGSRLYRSMRLTGLVHGIGASHYTPADVGVFDVGFEGDVGRVDEGIRGTLAQVRSLAECGPTDQELARVRALLRAQWARRFESMDGRASALCEAEALDDVSLVDELYRRALSVTAADVARVARAYLDPSQASAVVYLPSGASTTIDPGAWPLRDLATTAVAVPDVATRAFAATPRSNGWDTREHPGGVVHVSLPGADLLVRAKRGAGLATVGLHFAGVPSSETGETAGLSWLTVRAALRGAGGMDSEQVALAGELLGGGVSASVGAETMGWWLTVRSDALHDAAHLLRAVAGAPVLAPHDIAVERDRQVGDARSARDDMFRHPLQRALGTAFPDHAYGLPVLGEPDMVARFTADHVRRWSEGLSQRRAVVVAVGDLAPEQLFEALAPLADWPAHALPAANPHAPRWGAGHAAESRDKAQTALAMAFPAAPYRSADRYSLIVLSALLSGLAGRLFDALREQRSLAYTVAALPWLAARAGAFLTYIATSPEREVEARDAMIAELRRVCRQPPAEEELERARSYAAGTVEVKKQSGRAVAGELLEAWVYGGIEDVALVPQRIRGVTLAQVLDVAERVLDPERRAEYVVRGGGNR